MSLFEDVMALAVQLPMNERERVGRALGLSVHSKGPGKTLLLNQFVAQPSPQAADAWRKAETGHAVVDTAAQAAAIYPPGPPAVAGMWQGLDGEVEASATAGQFALASTLPTRSPAIVDTSVCRDLALGRAPALAFWNSGAVEPRLATATYISLLGAAQDESQLRRWHSFVQPFAVLSLRPMASSRAVELMLAHSQSDGLGALDALVAATALAHEIPLITAHPTPFANIAGLSVLIPY